MMDTYPGSEGSDGSGPNYADMYAGASFAMPSRCSGCEQFECIAECITKESARALVDDANRWQTAYNKARDELALAQKRKRVLRDNLGGAPHPTLVGHPVYTVWYESSRDALAQDSQTHGGEE